MILWQQYKKGSTGISTRTTPCWKVFSNQQFMVTSTFSKARTERPVDQELVEKEAILNVIKTVPPLMYEEYPIV